MNVSLIINIHSVSHCIKKKFVWRQKVKNMGVDIWENMWIYWEKYYEEKGFVNSVISQILPYSSEP